MASFPQRTRRKDPSLASLQAATAMAPRQIWNLHINRVLPSVAPARVIQKMKREGVASISSEILTSLILLITLGERWDRTCRRGSAFTSSSSSFARRLLHMRQHQNQSASGVLAQLFFFSYSRLWPHLNSISPSQARAYRVWHQFRGWLLRVDCAPFFLWLDQILCNDFFNVRIIGKCEWVCVPLVSINWLKINNEKKKNILKSTKPLWAWIYSDWYRRRLRKKSCSVKRYTT